MLVATRRQHIIAFLIAAAIWVVVICAFLIIKDARADEAFSYTTADGVLSLTDRADRVPAAYQAQPVELAPLADYGRLTVATSQAPIRLPQLQNSMAAAQRRVALNASAPRTAAIALPITATREMVWMEGVLGYTGARYVAVDVLRDGNGNVIATSLAEIGLGLLR